MQWTSQHPDRGVDLHYLETMQVLSSPPAWSYVKDQLEKLRDATSTMPAETRAEIEESVTTYFKALRESAEPLENAIYCATVLDTFSQTTRRSLAVDSLPWLGASVSRGRTRHECLRILKIIRDKLVAEFDGEKELQARRHLLTEGHIEEWLNSLTRIQDALVETVKAREKDKFEAAALAWKTWRQWALHTWPTPPKVSELDVWNLATRVADWPPGSILWDDPMTMTISAWTVALRSALRSGQYAEQAREWFIALILVQLGFSAQGQRTLMEQWAQQKSADLSDSKLLPEELHGFFNRIPQVPSRGSALVILTEPNTVVETWLPWIEMGCLAYRLSEATDVLEDATAMFLPPFRYIFFASREIPREFLLEEANRLLSTLRSRTELFKSASLILVGERPLARETPLPVYYLEAPNTFEEAVRHLETVPEDALRLR